MRTITPKQRKTEKNGEPYQELPENQNDPKGTLTTYPGGLEITHNKL